jgi:catechol 2,3-dioxygenase-like lactoylglutathione lyase family enzyme
VIVMPIVYVSDLERSSAFYERLGFRSTTTSRAGGWLELTSAGGILALHHADPLPRDLAARVELALVATAPLEEIVAAFAGRGVDVPIVDQPYGRTITLVDPDGLPITVNEHDQDL